MRRALVLLLLLAPTEAFAGSPRAAEAPGASARAGGEVEILAEGPTGLRLRWAACRGDGSRVLRVAIPPGAHVVLGADATLRLPAEAASVSVHGYVRDLPFADIVLDADSLPPGPAQATCPRTVKT